MKDEQVDKFVRDLEIALKPVIRKKPNRRTIFYDASIYWKMMKSQIQ